MSADKQRLAEAVDVVLSATVAEVVAALLDAVRRSTAPAAPTDTGPRRVPPQAPCASRGGR